MKTAPSADRPIRNDPPLPFLLISTTISPCYHYFPPPKIIASDMTNIMKRPTDIYGRTLYGDHIQLDFYPLRWIPGLLMLFFSHGHVPSIVSVIGVLLYTALFYHNQVFLIPRDTVPPRLRTRSKDACPSSHGSRSPRSTR